MRGQESRRAFGRRSEADSPLAYLILQAQEAIVRGETNKVGQAFVDLARSAPDERFWKVNKVTSKRKINDETGLVEDYTVNQLTAEDKDFTVVAKFDGKEVRVTMNRDNPAAARLADAMRRLTDQRVDAITRYLGVVNRWYSAVNTRFNPEFVISNMIRDMQAAGINLQDADVDGITAAAAKNYPGALKAAMRGARGKMDGDWGKWYDDFVMDGAKTAYAQIEDVAAIKKKIEGEFALSASRAGTDKSAGLKFKRGLLAVRDLVENTNDGVENAVRLAVYKAAREKGVSRTVAASMAKNVTVNFNRRGQLGPAMNALYLFYNASVQGNVRFMQALYYSPKVRAAVGAIALAGLSSEFLNAMMSDDDDDGESFYDKIPAHVKQRNMVIMLDGENYALVPLAYGLNAFWEAGRTAGEMWRRGGDRWQESAGNLVGTVVGAFNPIGFNTEGRSATEAMIGFITPTIADPIVDLSQNVDFTGKPIMPEENQYGPQDPDAQRYFPGVNTTMLAITDALTEATGGNKVEAGAIDVSPETLDYLADTIFGAAGSFLNRVTAVPQKVAAGEATVNDLPFVRKVFGSKSPYYDRGAFFDRLNEAEGVMKTGKDLLEAEMTEEFDRFAEDNRAVLTLEPEYKEASKLMKQIRKEKRGSEAMLEKGEIDQAQHDANVEILSDIETTVITNFNRRWVETVYEGDNAEPIE